MPHYPLVAVAFAPPIETPEPEDVWRLSDGSRYARALLLAHPAGRELRLVINGDVEQRHVHEDFALLLDQAYTWKEAMIINGWK
jgi:hypothetical protein